MRWDREAERLCARISLALRAAGSTPATFSGCEEALTGHKSPVGWSLSALGEFPARPNACLLPSLLLQLPVSLSTGGVPDYLSLSPKCPGKVPLPSCGLLPLLACLLLLFPRLATAQSRG